MGMVQRDQNTEKQIEKQMGCMGGFLNIFDRHLIFSGKRASSTKRLPPSMVVDSGQGSEKSGASSPAVSRELVKAQAALMTPLPGKMVKSPATEITPPKSPLPLPVFEMKDGSKTSWKFCKEAPPRLSLDSRATVDTKGSLHPREIRTNSASSILTPNADDQQRRSPSVIARLMGLEPLPADSNTFPEETNPKNVQLRRSGSESRVARDFFCYHPVDNNSNNYNSINSFQSNLPNYIARDGNECSADHTDMYSYKMAKNAISDQHKTVNNRGIVSSPWKAPQYRRSYFDAADVFPEPKKLAVSVNGDIEKRLKLRGIEEPSKDLEALKQILEALQLKGLLHSNNLPSEQRNFVYDRSFWSSDESPIVVMRTSNSPVNLRMGSESSPSRYGVRRSPNNRNLTGECLPSSSPRKNRPMNDRGPTRAGNARSSNSRSSSGNSIIKPKPLPVETQRSMDSRRVSPAAHSPKLSPRKNVMSQNPTASPRRRRLTGTNTVITDDESSSISESTISTPSQTDTERSKTEDYREGGKSLLERCDKLLHCIAEMNSIAAADMQPSPVSVLDLVFLRDESSSSTSSPSPVMKRSIDFKDNEQEQASVLDLDEEAWSCILRPDDQSILGDSPTTTDDDLVYISEILMASQSLPVDCDVFLLMEKQQYYLKGRDTTKVSRLQRRLIFDVVVEILDRNRKLPPWMAFSWADSRIVRSSIRRIWLEYIKIRERDSSEHDLLETICGVLKKDLAGDAISGWGDCPPVEFSEVVLDIERLIFKDLIGESIRDLAEFASKSGNSLAPVPRRKLIF